MYVCVYIYIYTYRRRHALRPPTAQRRERLRRAAVPGAVPGGPQGGDHLSNTTCLTQVFFKSGE